jgi:hypothetical protein
MKKVPPSLLLLLLLLLSFSNGSGLFKILPDLSLSTEIRTFEHAKCFPNSHPTNSLANNIKVGILTPKHKNVIISGKKSNKVLLVENNSIRIQIFDLNK